MEGKAGAGGQVGRRPKETKSKLRKKEKKTNQKPSK